MAQAVADGAQQVAHPGIRWGLVSLNPRETQLEIQVTGYGCARRGRHRAYLRNWGSGLGKAGTGGGALALDLGSCRYTDPSIIQFTTWTGLGLGAWRLL